MGSAPLYDVVDPALDLTVVPGFSRLGIATRRQLGTWSDELPSMSGRAVVVTGGSSGLGKATAARLSSLGASVDLASGRFWMDRRARPTHKVPWTRSGDAHRHVLWERVTELAGTREPAPLDPDSKETN